jgi:O-antigen ligase
MVVPLAVALGVLTEVQPNAAAAVAAVLVLGALLLSTPTVSRPIDLGDRRFRWLAFAWAYLLIRPIGHFTAGRTQLTAVAGHASVENVLDLGTHAVIAASVLWSLRRNRLRPRPSWLLLALPAASLASAAWSLAPTVTLGFSFELVVDWLLAMLTASVLLVDPELGRALLRRTLRIVVVLVAVLSIIGLIFPYGGGTSADHGVRFAWPGEHPLVATAEIGLALLVTVFAARDEIGFSRNARIALAVLFGACLYLGNSRTAFAGLVAAALFGYWIVSKGSGFARRLAGAAAIAALVLLIASSFGGAITHYLYRGQSQSTVFGLNGRLGLWTFAVHQLHTPAQWLFGYGLSSSRVLLANNVAWAGDAHGAWIELLVSLGLLGVTLGVALVATLAVRLVRSATRGLLASRVLPILFVYVVAMSPAATGFAAPGPEPGLAFALLAFCYAATATLQRAPSSVLAAPGWPLASDLRSASA